MNRIFRIAALLTLLVSIPAHSAVRGATVPFATLEAESASYGGGASLNVDPIIAEASSERSYVHLGATGSFVQFVNCPAANRLTLRYSIPRNTAGTISLYLNNSHNQDIKLISTQCYDAADTTKIRRYDEISVTVATTAGSTITIQKDAGDSCPWYGIDLIDLEAVPAPLSMPANFLSIADYGATVNDTTDDTKAIQACIAAAAAQNKGVWVPAGTFCQNTRTTVPVNVDIKGAGLWYSTIRNTVAGTTFSNDIGYALTSGTTISDIKFTGVATARGIACILFRSMGNNDTLQNLWIQNVGCVHGWEGTTPVSNNVIKNSRIIGTYFDGVHWGDGTAYHNLAENLYFRGMGDDAIAQVNRADQPLCYRNVAQFNTVVASYWGRGLSDVGGDTLTMADNIISSVYNAGIIITTETLSPSVSRPIRGFQCLRNTVTKCGHSTSAVGNNLAGIHFYLGYNPMQNVVIQDNTIEYGETKGIRIDNTGFGDSTGRTIFANNISHCNAQANYDDASTLIVPTLTGNDFVGCPATDVEFGRRSKGLSPTVSSEFGIHLNESRDAILVRYLVNKPGRVVVTIHDILGREMACLVNEEKPVGPFDAAWATGAPKSGVYFCTVCIDGVARSLQIVRTK